MKPGVLADVSNLRFTDLVPFHYIGAMKWECRCVCGKTVVTTGTALRSGKVKSCGCTRSKRAHKTHGEYNTKFYGLWCSIKRRCIHQQGYCDRGITVCREWVNDFAAFKAWCVAQDPSEGLQLDRIDNDAGYSPANCRFVTRSENCNNRRSNRRITAWGESKTIAEWVLDPRAKVYGRNIGSRLDSGWSPERAISEDLCPLAESLRRAMQVNPNNRRGWKDRK